jgi:hypothetical protein
LYRKSNNADERDVIDSKVNPRQFRTAICRLLALWDQLTLGACSNLGIRLTVESNNHDIPLMSRSFRGFGPAPDEGARVMTSQRFGNRAA